MFFRAFIPFVGCLRKSWDVNWALDCEGQGWDGRRHSGCQPWHGEPGIFLSPVWGVLVLLSLPRVTFLPHGMIPAIPSFFTPENHPEWPPHIQKSFLRCQRMFCIFFFHLPKCGQPLMNINPGTSEIWSRSHSPPHPNLPIFYFLIPPHPAHGAFSSLHFFFFFFSPSWSPRDISNISNGSVHNGFQSLAVSPLNEKNKYLGSSCTCQQWSNLCRQLWKQWQSEELCIAW